jgi:hypothetical protein
MVTLADALASAVPDISLPVKDENGNIAIRYAQEGQVMTRCGNREYLFRTQANICMAWIPESDSACVLAKRGGCCNQQRPGVFRYANAASARRWTVGGGR